jgi:hypothetical protein
MKLQRTITVTVLALILSVGAAWAAEKTCCEKAAEAGKECRNKCCVAAHKSGKSCERCNPQKQDLKLLKKAEKKPEAKKDKEADKK